MDFEWEKVTSVGMAIAKAIIRFNGEAGHPRKGPDLRPQCFPRAETFFWLIQKRCCYDGQGQNFRASKGNTAEHGTKLSPSHAKIEKDQGCNLCSTRDEVVWKTGESNALVAKVDELKKVASPLRDLSRSEKEKT